MFKLKDNYTFSRSFARMITYRYCKDNDIYDIFLENMAEHGSTITFPYDINTSFHWNETTQGRDFWYIHYIKCSNFYNKEIKKYKDYTDSEYDFDVDEEDDKVFPILNF